MRLRMHPFKALAAGLVVILCGMLYLSAYARERKKTVFYVSPRGNDRWPGILPVPNRAGTDGPFATIARARDAIREIKAAGKLFGPATVFIRGGAYFLSRPVTFTPQDSGTKTAPVLYTAYPGETPVLCGGRKITGFKPFRGKIVRAYLPEVESGAWYFRQLFSDGKRQTRARYPNIDPSDPYRKGFLYVEGSLPSFGLSVGNIHNPGDWMEYEVSAPSPGLYRLWLYYGADNAPYGADDMAGRTGLSVDGGEPVPLQNLPNTGGWGAYRWSECASVELSEGTHRLKWQNLKGGGIQLDALALSDDPGWKPVGTDLPRTAPGRHLVVIQAESFAAFNGPQISIAGDGGSKTQFLYRPGTVKPSWAGQPGAEMHIYPAGGACRAYKQITDLIAVDESTRTVTLGGQECTVALSPGNRFFVENVLAELDSPGEWFLDRKEGYLYLWPEKPLTARSEVIAPVLGRVFEFLGDSGQGKPVHHITLSGLIVRNTDYSPEDGCVGYGMGNDGVVFMRNASDCAVRHSNFKHIGKYAVCLAGSDRNAVTGCRISDGAEGGILLIDAADNRITDNHISRMGLVYKHIAGITMEDGRTGGNIVAHNLIHDISRYGITLKSPGSRNIVEFNDLRTLNTETYDTGGIEVTQQDREFRSGSIIRNNRVRDVIGYSSDNGKAIFLSWGIYLDSFAGGYTVQNNIVCRNENGSVMIQGGKDNRIENNILGGGRSSQLFLPNFAGNCAGNVISRNIVYYEEPEALLIYAGPITPEAVFIDNNLYFHAGGRPLRVNRADSFAGWQALGYDAHSVIADPLFQDPARDDYRLRPGSPALEMGFKPIDITTVGPRRKP
ncbi:MAG: right-handed parallel beta-helix repeat-containing protein [Armatimonadetes bacterium]|nr:right-handed parallel beta-helix repeat-containing protein [Armatimonadota bacterium]